MQTIQKKEILVVASQKISFPKGAEILCVETQEDKPYVFFKFDTITSKDETREIHTYGSHNPVLADDSKYVGTYKLQNGLTLHVFVVDEVGSGV